MNIIDRQIELVLRWISEAEFLPSGRGRYEIRRALTEERARGRFGSDFRRVRKAVMDSLDGGDKRSWDYKGIYVWFWERQGSSPQDHAWPLYVGKTAASSGMRGRHLADHTRGPTPDKKTDGVIREMLCDPIESRRSRTLMIFSTEGVKTAAKFPQARSHDDCVAANMLSQFRPMHLLLLPMNDEELKFLSQAEGLILAASELLHHKFNASECGSLSCMLNSAGKTSSLGMGLEELCLHKGVESISEKLLSLMDGAPRGGGRQRLE